MSSSSNDLLNLLKILVVLIVLVAVINFVSFVMKYFWFVVGFIVVVAVLIYYEDILKILRE